MRPLFVLLLIVTGSAVAIAVSLARRPSCSYCCPSTRCAWPGARSFDYRPALVWILSGVGTAALVGEWRARPWRRYAYTALGLMLLVLAGCTAPLSPQAASPALRMLRTRPPSVQGPLPGRLRSPSLASGIRSFSLSARRLST